MGEQSRCLSWFSHASILGQCILSCCQICPLAFQRFCNMYSIPQYLYSDNAKTSIKGGNILETSLQSKEFQDELEKCEIKHIRISLYSAWVEAAWERLIRVLKCFLYKVTGRARLTYFDLLIVNSRPPNL